MRVFSVLFLVVALADLTAGTLDLAVLSFPEKKTGSALTEALAGQSLAELSNSNRTMTKKSYLKGGSVLFAQSLPLGRGQNFRSSTRLNDNRADVEGRLDDQNVSVVVTLMDGVKAGFRSFRKTVYKGNGSLPVGSPRILSLKVISTKDPKVVKGRSKMEYSDRTVVVVAQFKP